jgi:uncharacterized protein (DUF1697 family)
MSKSLALLRGINVGGNTMIKMTELREALESAGFEDVSTYINSGNVIFRTARGKGPRQVEKVISDTFGHAVGVVCFTDKEYLAMIKAAPKTWGAEETSRHNLFALLDPSERDEIIARIGELRPGIETLDAGKGVLYQSMEIASVGKATTGSKIVSKPVYKRITVRNYNTAQKLAKLLEPAE